MVFARKWSQILSFIARLLFFLIIILQVPLFRVPYRGEICTTPVELTCCHLIATEIWPSVVVKSLIYPRAFANALHKDTTIPSFDNILHIYPNIRNPKASHSKIDLHRIEVLVGSYLSVGGAVLGCLKPGRMGLAGMLLTLWGLKKDFFLRNETRTRAIETVYVYPAMWIAIVLAFVSIRGDLRKLLLCFRLRRKSKNYRF